MRNLLLPSLLVVLNLSLCLGQSATGENVEPAAKSEGETVLQAFPTLMRIYESVKVDQGGNVEQIWTDGRFCVTEDRMRVVHCGRILSFKPLVVEWAFKGDVNGAIAEYDKYQRMLYVGESLDSVLRKIGKSGLRDVSDSVGFTPLMPSRFKWHADRYYKSGKDKLLSIKYIEYDGRIVLDRMSFLKVDWEGRSGKRILESEMMDQFVLPDVKTQ